MKNYLDMLSNDIKLAEEYLFHYPLIEDMEYATEKHQALTWTKSRIHLTTYDVVEGTTSVKPFIECSVKQRVDNYPYLAHFMMHCIKEHEKLMDLDALMLTHKAIEDLLRN